MNFIDAFRKWVGRTECPDQFIEWAALSLIAAACGDRIYVPYRRGNDDIKVVPNLYTLLVGPSGAHKSFAISRIMRIIQAITEAESNSGTSRRLNTYPGHITHSGMYDAMRTERRKRMPDGSTATISLPWASQFYLVQDELAQCLGAPADAELVIRALTGMFYGAPFSDATRTHGRVHLEDYCINWVAGTNIDWLLKSVSPNTLNAGFFRRTVTIHSDSTSERVYPFTRERPAGWSEVFPSLVARIDYLLDSEGAITLTKEAFEIDKHWYLSLVNPSIDDHGIATVSGRHDLSLRLALILALANDEDTITGSRLAEAQDKTAQVCKWQALILPIIRKGEVGSPSDRVLQYVLGRGGAAVAHSRLAKYAYEKCAIDARRLDDLLATWMRAGLIVSMRRNKVTYYKGDA